MNLEQVKSFPGGRIGKNWSVRSLPRTGFWGLCFSVVWDNGVSLSRADTDRAKRWVAPTEDWLADSLVDGRYE